MKFRNEETQEHDKYRNEEQHDTKRESPGRKAQRILKLMMRIQPTAEIKLKIRIIRRKMGAIYLTQILT